jgi:protein-tyrosine phosphatase
VAPVDRLSLPNLRDIGGYETRDGGRVRHGMLYRSSAPVGLTAAEVAELESMDLRSVFDLRSRPERRLAPDVLPDETDHSGIDVLAGTSSLTPVDQERLMADPRTAGQILAGKSGSEVSEQRFLDLVRLQSARRGFGRIFASLADETHRPALIHCSTGKDRTGWAIAAFLSLLDVPREQVTADYLLSAELLEPITQGARRAFIAQGGDGPLFDSLAGVRRESLDAAFDEIDRRYGSVDGYFERGLGLDASTRQVLRAAFVEPPSK